MTESNGNTTKSQSPDQNSKGKALAGSRQQSDSDGNTVRNGTGPRRRRQRIWGSKRSLPLVAVTLAVVASLGFTSLSSPKPANHVEEQLRVLAVQTTVVQPVTSYQAAREYTGKIVARRTSQLGFELAGKLTELHVGEGESVTAGAVLAQLDTEHLETNRTKFVAKRAQAVAKLDEMVAGPRHEDIAAARARVESLQSQVELLKLQSARQERLLAERATSTDQYEQIKFGLQARQSQLDEAKHDLAELLNGTRKEQIAAQQASVAELDAAIADIDVAIRKSTLSAPFDGTIARRLADEGTVVEQGHAVFRLIEDRALEAWIGLPVQAAQQLVDNTAQHISIAGRPFEATVASRFPEVDPATRTRTAVLRLDSSAADYVVHGQVVRLKLEETVEAAGFWLPSTALAKGARGLWTVFAVVTTETVGSTQPDLYRVERRKVEVLHTESDRVLVRGTLNPADRVITNGTHRVVPGEIVRLATSIRSS